MGALIINKSYRKNGGVTLVVTAKNIIKNCTHCNMKRNCGQCLFLLKKKNGQIICPSIQTDERLKKEFSTFLTYAESHPGDYEKLLSSIVID